MKTEKRKQRTENRKRKNKLLQYYLHLPISCRAAGQFIVCHIGVPNHRQPTLGHSRQLCWRDVHFCTTIMQKYKRILRLFRRVVKVVNNILYIK